MDHLPAVLPGWGQVTPFVLPSSGLFPPADPPALTSEDYARDYQEVQAIGAKDSTVRTPTRRRLRASGSGVPRRLESDRADHCGRLELDAWESARVLALVNLAMADGVIAGFDTKYQVNRWRPITAIRAGDTDGNEETVGDPTWENLLNTPAHPDYVSTHAVQGGAAAAVLRQVFGTKSGGLHRHQRGPVCRADAHVQPLVSRSTGKRRLTGIRRCALPERHDQRSHAGASGRPVHRQACVAAGYGGESNSSGTTIDRI